MFFPVGSDKDEVWRTPWVTFSIIGLNILIFIIAYPMTLHDQRRADEAAQKVQQYLDAHPELMDSDRMDDLARAGIVTKVDAEYLKWTLNLMGRQHADLGDEYNEEFAEYERLLTAYLRLRHTGIEERLGYIPARHRVWDMFTSMFVDNGLFHLLQTMLFFFAVGFSIEDLWGRYVFAGIYLISGLAGCLLHTAFYSDSYLPLVGASGAVAGVMGAYLIRLHQAKIKFFYVRLSIFSIGSGNYYGYFSLPAYVYLPLWFVVELGWGWVVRHGDSASAHWAHVGGFAFGMAVAGAIKLSGFEENYLKPSIDSKVEFGSDKKVSDALEVLAKGDVVNAEIMLKMYVGRHPEDANGFLAQVQVYQKMENVERLRETYVKLIRLQVRAHEFEAAVMSYDGLLGTFTEEDPVLPLDMRDWMPICDQLARMEMYNEAAVEYRRAGRTQKADPFAAKALMLSGEIFLNKLNANREAAISFLEAQALNPNPQNWVERINAGIEKIRELEIARISANQKYEEKPVNLPKVSPESELRIPPKGLSL